MQLIRKSLAIAFLILALAAAIYAVMHQIVTLATNDPRDYQSLLISGLKWSAVSFVGAVVYCFLARGRWRYAVVLPLAIALIDCIGIARQWPYAFP